MALVRLRSCTLLRRSLAPASSSASSSSSSSSALFSSSTAVAADAAPSDSSSAPLGATAPAPVPVLRTIKHLRSARPWGENSKRVGLLGIKCGMTRGWDAFGKHLPLTVIKIDHCFVTQVKPEVSPSGFIGIQVGASLINPKNVAKPQRLHLEKANLPPLRQMVEFQVTPDAIVHAGTKLDLRHFAVGQYIDVRGISKGHGFTGAMKRWNFRGQPASHGVSLAHRSLGATGSRQDPGKVFKGKRMAGRMGHENVTVQNLRVHKLDTWNELIFVVGAVPGVVGSYVKMTDAVKQRQSARKAPFPTYVHHKGDLRHQWIIEGPPKKDPFAVPHHVVPL